MIDINKKYKTRSGRSVRILCVDACRTFCVIALILIEGKEDVFAFTKEGKCFDIDDKESQYDLIEVLPYEDFKTDDLCVVWAEHSGSAFRYFSHVDKHSGEAVCFAEGRTSFTHDSFTTWPTTWPNCRKATEEEIASKTIA